MYTSSAAAAIPSPFSALYASTKSFISSFGASLAPEVRAPAVAAAPSHVPPRPAHGLAAPSRPPEQQYYKRRPAQAHVCARYLCSRPSPLLPLQVKPYGIDVLVFHPSPVASRFYDKAHKLDVLEFFRR